MTCHVCLRKLCQRVRPARLPRHLLRGCTLISCGDGLVKSIIPLKYRMDDETMCAYFDEERGPWSAPTLCLLRHTKKIGSNWIHASFYLSQTSQRNRPCIHPSGIKPSVSNRNSFFEEFLSTIDGSSSRVQLPPTSALFTSGRLSFYCPFSSG